MVRLRQRVQRPVGAPANDEIEGRFGSIGPFRKAVKERPVMAAQPSRSAIDCFPAHIARPLGQP